MQVPTVLLLVVLIAIALFAAINWSAFIALVPLSLLVTTIQAPLGLIMLGLLALLTVLFLMFVVYLQTSVLFQARRHTRALEVQRELADQAEASRFIQLKGFIEAELIKLAAESAASQVSVLARLNQVEQDLRVVIEQGGNTLAAYIGELEDRLEREIRSQQPGSQT
jgi:uncharacterized integral membrane protein